MQNSVENKSESSGTHKSKLNTPVFSSSNSFTMRASILGQPKLSSGFVLRPSQLGNKVESKSHSYSLNPSRLNPFAKSTSDVEVENGQAKETNGSTDEASSSSKVDVPKFVPLAVTESSRQCTSSSSVTSTPNFVFGQNLHERIVAENEKAAEAGTTSIQPSASASTSHANANGTSELLFSSAVKNTPAASDKEVKSLSESAREYEESRANKRKYEEVTVVTGEEDEKNVLQINCKLFTFDKATSNWQERGRGTLRLNDKEIQGEKYPQSRLVFRTAGSLRVVLNTKVYKTRRV